MFIRTPLEVAELRDTLEKLIGDDLGTFENGLPAIWVEDPPAPPNGKGLHCFIYYRARQVKPSVGLLQSIQVLAWQVMLLQTDRTVDGIQTLSLVGDKIRNSFSGCSEGQSASLSDRLPTLNYSIPFTKVCNPTQLY
jgi:hypothetical protein